MKKILIIIAGTALLYSCDKKQSTIVENNGVAVSDSAAVAAEDGLSVAGEETQTLNTASGNQNIAGKPALNPEHGQPFHRCDISVGAPIDSAPQQAAAPQVAPQMQNASNNFIPAANPSPAPSPAQALPMSTAVGPKPAKNPAHGEPHHRCDLQVGAPLI